MTPTQVIDMHVDLVNRFQEKDFRSIIDGSFAGAMSFADFSDRDAWFRTASPRQRVMGYVKANDPARLAVNATEALARHVRAAYAYRVTPDMGVLVQHAAQQLDADDVFDPSLAPTGCGLVRFDRPMPIADVRGKTMLGHWLIWGPVAGGTMTAWFNDTADPDEIGRELFNGWDDQKIARVRRMIGRWAWVGADVTRAGDSPLGDPTWTPNPEQARLIEQDGDTPTPAQNTIRYVHALWLMLNQTITTVEDDEKADRPARRRAGRMGIPDRVTVIRLRRSEGSQRADGESMVQWSHRWVVRGHWRWQACGVGRTERRRIWIHAFEKGPADKPLVVTDKVYDLSR